MTDFSSLDSQRAMGGPNATQEANAQHEFGRSSAVWTSRPAVPFVDGDCLTSKISRARGVSFSH